MFPGLAIKNFEIWKVYIVNGVKDLKESAFVSVTNDSVFEWLKYLYYCTTWTEMLAHLWRGIVSPLTTKNV